MQIPLYKRLLSNFYPVRIRKSSGEHNSLLELFLYQRQFQLGTIDALYSDGRRYRPVLAAVQNLGQRLQQVKTVLTLGAGIGSIIDVFAYKGYKPVYTLVDIDSTVLSWAVEIHAAGKENINTVCASAETFIDGNTEKYDLLFADVFIGRKVPAFATSGAFLQKCRQGINPGGIFVMNYMVNNMDDWQITQQVIESVFPGCTILPLEINRIIIASV